MSNKILKYFIAIIWFANGFYCKILNQIPRHQEIVSRILSDAYAREITFTIGVLEIFMMIWVLSTYKSKLNAITQIVIVMTMNIIEFFLAKDLLFYGNLNFVFAILFCAVIYYQEFILKKKSYV